MIAISSEYKKFTDEIIKPHIKQTYKDRWPNFTSIPPLIESYKTDFNFDESNNKISFKYNNKITNNSSAAQVSANQAIYFSIKFSLNKIYNIIPNIISSGAMSRTTLLTPSIAQVWVSWAHLDTPTLSEIPTITNGLIKMDTAGNNIYYCSIPGTAKDLIIWNVIAVDTLGRVTTCCMPWRVNPIGTLLDYGSTPLAYTIKYFIDYKNKKTETNFLNNSAEAYMSMNNTTPLKKIYIGQQSYASTSGSDTERAKSIQIRDNFLDTTFYDWGTLPEFNQAYGLLLGVNTLQSLVNITGVNTKNKKAMGMARFLTRSTVSLERMNQIVYTTAQKNALKHPPVFAEATIFDNYHLEFELTKNNSYKSFYDSYYGFTLPSTNENNKQIYRDEIVDQDKNGSPAMSFGNNKIIINGKFWDNRTPWDIDNPLIIGLGAGKTYTTNNLAENYYTELYRVLPPIAVYPRYFMVRTA